MGPKCEEEDKRGKENESLSDNQRVESLYL